VGKLLVAVCLRCAKNRLSHNLKPQHIVSLSIVLVTWWFQTSVFYQRQNSHGVYFASWGKVDSIFLMSYLEVFGVLTGVGADVSKFFGAGVLKHGAGAESESEKCDSAHLCSGWCSKSSKLKLFCDDKFKLV